MGGGSEGDEERIRAPQLPVLSSNGSLETKPHGKQFYDDGVIPHSVIPRKLRSAMKKRARKHVSLPNDRKKQHHSSSEVERPQLHNSKKSGQNMPGEFSPKLTMSESFTQDEQEVAETLYRLAKMFLNNKPIKRRAYRRTKVAKSSPLQEMSESCILAPEGQPVETVKENRHFAKSSARENPPNLNLGLDIYAFQQSNDVANMTVSSKFFPGTRTVQSMQHESPLPDHKDGLFDIEWKDDDHLSISQTDERKLHASLLERISKAYPECAVSFDHLGAANFQIPELWSNYQIPRCLHCRNLSKL